MALDDVRETAPTQPAANGTVTVPALTEEERTAVSAVLTTEYGLLAGAINTAWPLFPTPPGEVDAPF